ncbi:hypothetical protein [Streptomyces longisporoflavus]|uniref:Uncharacterized protein n=1 Tax=Streptomyces longisporoflavus TaxID=28044 RepID=A0ABW7QIJ4_9ACTN
MIGRTLQRPHRRLASTKGCTGPEVRPPSYAGDEPAAASGAGTAWTPAAAQNISRRCSAAGWAKATRSRCRTLWASSRRIFVSTRSRAPLATRASRTRSRSSSVSAAPPPT